MDRRVVLGLFVLGLVALSLYSKYHTARSVDVSISRFECPGFREALLSLDLDCELDLKIQSRGRDELIGSDLVLQLYFEDQILGQISRPGRFRIPPIGQTEIIPLRIKIDMLQAVKNFERIAKKIKEKAKGEWRLLGSVHVKYGLFSFSVPLSLKI